VGYCRIVVGNHNHSKTHIQYFFASKRYSINRSSGNVMKPRSVALRSVDRRLDGAQWAARCRPPAGGSTVRSVVELQWYGSGQSVRACALVRCHQGRKVQCVVSGSTVVRSADRQASTRPLVVYRLRRTTNYSFLLRHRQYYSFGVSDKYTPGHRQNYSFGDSRRSLLPYRLMSVLLRCCCFFRRLAGVRS
jgi:hypothetical protein